MSTLQLPVPLRAPGPTLAARHPGSMPAQRFARAAAVSLALTGCASTAINDNFSSAQQLSRQRLGAEVRWLTTDAERAQAKADVDALLAQPLAGDDAVRVALAYSPALQAMLYEAAIGSASLSGCCRGHQRH